jgi:metallo-beta-lactamase class B
MMRTPSSFLCEEGGPQILRLATLAQHDTFGIGRDLLGARGNKFVTSDRIERDNSARKVGREAPAGRCEDLRVTIPTVFRRLLAVSLLWPAFVLLLQTVRGHAQNPEWTEPFPPFRIMGNLYYVGSKDLAAYLVVTPAGNILINSNLESSVPQIRASVEKLGFKFSDTKILLISHAHWDHDAGSAAIKQMTGARYMVMDADVGVVEDGGKSDFAYGKNRSNWYRPAKVDRVLHDGDEVRLGDAVLAAHKTPGHTRGCTTWTMKVNDNGKIYDAVIVGSPNVNPGYRLAGRPSYPRIAADYEKTFRVLKSLHCDLFLGAHGEYFGLNAKYARLKAGDRTAFVDPTGYAGYVAEREDTFNKELVRQRAKYRDSSLRSE